MLPAAERSEVWMTFPPMLSAAISGDMEVRFLALWKRNGGYQEDE
jgi:hypothetical protein